MAYSHENVDKHYQALKIRNEFSCEYSNDLYRCKGCKFYYNDENRVTKCLMQEIKEYLLFRLEY